jgi:hypothetical protein
LAADRQRPKKVNPGCLHSRDSRHHVGFFSLCCCFLLPVSCRNRRMVQWTFDEYGLRVITLPTITWPARRRPA